MSETILIADDSLMVRETATAALQARGARLVTAKGGEEALAALRQETTSLLIADVHLPGVDGYELCHAARELDPRPVVLLLVGTFEAFDEAAARESGAEAVLRKPFAAQELRERVESLLGPAPGEEVEREEAVASEPPAPATTGPAPPVEEAGADGEELSEAAIDRIARRVLDLGGAEILERVAREVLEESASRLLRERETADGGGDRPSDR